MTRWSAQEREFFKTNYERYTYAQLARIMNKSVKAVGQMARRMGLGRPEPEQTLCWRCARAAGKKSEQCSWAKYFIPVKGWRAYPTVIRHDCFPDGRYGSYFVEECPQFILDKRCKEIEET